MVCRVSPIIRVTGGNWLMSSMPDDPPPITDDMICWTMAAGFPLDIPDMGLGTKAGGGAAAGGAATGAAGLIAAAVGALLWSVPVAPAVRRVPG